MSASIEQLISGLDNKSCRAGLEMPFLPFAAVAFDRISEEILSGQLATRGIVNALYVLFALLETCPDRADELLRITLHITQEDTNDEATTYAATTAIRVAMLAKHPQVEVSPMHITQLRATLQEVIDRGVDANSREYFEAFLAADKQN